MFFFIRFLLYCLLFLSLLKVFVTIYVTVGELDLICGTTFDHNSSMIRGLWRKRSKHVSPIIVDVHLMTYKQGQNCVCFMNLMESLLGPSRVNLRLRCHLRHQMPDSHMEESTLEDVLARAKKLKDQAQKENKESDINRAPTLILG